MSRKIILQKATRIEGNANIHIEIEKGKVKTARFMVHDFRGFEKMMQGKRVEYVPHMVSRICGLCCNAHQVAGFKAIENALNIAVPPSVENLRKIAVLAEWISSHALSYFFLSCPELDGQPNSVFDLMRLYPEYAKSAFELRKSGNQILEIIGKRAVHPVAMGVGRFLIPPTQEDLNEIGRIADKTRELSALLIKQLGERKIRKRNINFPDDHKVNFLSFDHAGDDETFSVFDQSGNKTESFSKNTFADNISELRVDWSLAKFPYLTHKGFPDGMLLVGPLSRLFQKESILADQEIRDFAFADSLQNPAALNLTHFDTCRLLEIFWAAKKIRHLLAGINRSELNSNNVKLEGSGTGIGVVEAPRGVLVHSYLIENGKIDRMRLLVATQFNNAYINLVLRNMAENNTQGEDSLSPEGEELVGKCIRTFDPCLTCATH